VKVYDLSISPLVRVLPFVVLGVFTLGFPLLILRTQGPPPLLIVPVVAIIGWQWWMILTLAYRVIVHDDGSIEWVALARRVRIPPEDVREIGPDSTGGIGFFRVSHASGKIRFLNQITGFHEVLAHIKDHNSGVVVKGC
jgi:hypothetical protein